MATKKKAAPKRKAPPTTKPTGAAALAAALVVLQGSLAKGEQFAGIVQENGRWNAVVLLPGELEAGTWAGAKTWAKDQGGTLPTRREQSLLFANLKDEFQPRSYWSSEQHAEHSDHAWGQNFRYGYQGSWSKNSKLRARAVRRFVIQ